MKKSIAFMALGGLLAAGSAQAFESTLTIGAMAGTTGIGPEASWRFHERFSVSANYTDGLDYSGDYETDDVNYSGDIGLQAGMLKFDYFPFAGRFYLTAGAALPDMTADVNGTSNLSGGEFEFNGNLYNQEDIGSLNGSLVIADSVQPYVGIGWRSSHRSGFGVFSELGVMTTDVDVSLSTANGLEQSNAQLASDLREEERKLQEDADELPVFPVVTLGVSYTL